MLPPSTNADYHGAPVAAWVLGFAGMTTILPGIIHYFLPDGGAGVIAGLDLSTRRETILALFAWMGAMQIPHGLLELLIALRYRSLVPLGLMLVLLERGLMAADGWFGKASLTGHHPPEHYASPVAVVVAGVALLLALRRHAVVQER